MTAATSPGCVTSPGRKSSIATTASRVDGATVACSSSPPAMWSRKSATDHSVRSDPTIVRPRGSCPASASWAIAGNSKRLVKISGRSEEHDPFDHPMAPSVIGRRCRGCRGVRTA